MKKINSWNDVFELKFNDNFEFNGKWSIEKADFTDRDRLEGILKYNRDQYSLSVNSQFYPDAKQGIIKRKSIYSKGDSGVIIKIVDAYIKVSANMLEKDKPEVWNSRGIVFYKDIDSFNVDYTEVIFSFGYFPDGSLNFLEGREIVELCDRLKIKDQIAKVYSIKNFYGDLDDNLNFKFSFESKIDIQFALKVVVTLERLLEINFGGIVSPTDIYLTNKNGNICKIFLPIDHPLNTPVINSIRKFTSIRRRNNLGLVIKNWFISLQDESGINSLAMNYLLTLNADSAVTNGLINITQGIENFYKNKKVKNTRGVKKANDIEEKANEFKNKFADNSNVINEFNKFYNLLIPNISYLKKEKNIRLYKKLDLFVEELEISNDNNKLLLDILSDITIIDESSSENKVTDINVWLKSLKNTRVKITHGDNKYPQLYNVEDMKITVDVLSVLVRCYILKKVGADSCELFLKLNLEDLIDNVFVWKNDLSLI